MLEWIKTKEQMPELKKEGNFFSSDIILGWDGDETCPYILCMYQEGTDDGGWKLWLGSFGDEWEEIYEAPELWAEVNPPNN